MADFVHLHVHTDYSLLDGAGRIKDYVKKCVADGMDALAITDHGNMFGVVDFYRKCRKAGIKPIIGSEFYLCPQDMEIKDDSNMTRYHLILLAKNEQGYRNLCRLSSASYTKGFYYKPRVDKKTLQEYSEGIVCLSACIAGEIPQLLLGDGYAKAREAALWYEEIYGKGSFFLEIQRHGLEEEKIVNPGLIKLSEELGIPLVATNDAHYVNRDDAEAQDILMCIGMQRKLSDENRFKFDGDSYYLKTQQEMRKLFSDIPEAVGNTLKVSELCQLEINFPGPLLPPYPVPPPYGNEAEFLTHIANEGLVRRYGENVPDEYRKRMEYELSVIIKMDFPGYYLIVYDYINWAKNNDVPVGPGRGSGAGSIVAYCIGITDIDPMKYDLLFERFLNPERHSMPDFDVDFCTDKREMVINYVRDKYGEANVGQICTFGTLKVKQCIADVGRVLDIPLGEVNAMKKCIIEDLDLTFDWLLNGHTRDDGSVYAKNEEFLSYRDKGPLYEKLFEIVPKLEGMVRGTGLHAAGIVIGGKPLDEYVPLYMDYKNSNGLAATQYDKTIIEDCGLVKMDFLGLQTLTLIRHAENFIRQKQPGFDINEIPENDSRTMELLDNGDSQCVFQFESGGMRSVLKQSCPRNISDLSALNALYRPGPMDNIPLYIEGKKNPEDVKYPFPELKSLLAETYGVIVYQEQVMKVAQIFARYSLGEADILRKIMGKKKKEEIPAAREKFIAKSVENGKNRKDAEELFALLEPFAGYGFNKSHAVAYTYVAYQTAYLKANFPVEYMAANLIMEAQGSNTDKFSQYLFLTKEMGIRILPPDVNKSDKLFTVYDGMIVYGLAGIKNVGTGCVENILQERGENGPFEDFIDFLVRMCDKGINQRVVQNLIYGGAFDCFGIDRDVLDVNLKSAMDYAISEKNDRKNGSTSLFAFADDGENEDMLKFQFKDVREHWGKDMLLRFEHDVLGIFFSGHPLDKYKSQIKRCIRCPLAGVRKFDKNSNEEVVSYPARQFPVIVYVEKKTEISTKNGKLMGKLLVSDYISSREVLVWSKEWERYKGDICEGNVICMDLESREGGDTLVMKSIRDVESLPGAEVSVCRIYIKPETDRKEIEQLRSYLHLQSGSVRVSFMIYDEKGDIKEYRSGITVDDDSGIFDEIRTYPCVEDCALV